jgi:hypothetical protein
MIRVFMMKVVSIITLIDLNVSQVADGLIHSVAAGESKAGDPAAVMTALREMKNSFKG